MFLNKPSVPKKEFFNYHLPLRRDEPLSHNRCCSCIRKSKSAPE